MKLYVFESCPYCLRARIMVGWQHLSPAIIPLAPGAFPEDLAQRAPKRTVPVLVDGDVVLQDSADIIRHFDHKGTPLLSSYQFSPEFDALQARLSAPFNALCYPRILHLGVAELAAPQARQFFKTEVPQRIGLSFSDALAQTDDFVSEINQLLPDLIHFIDDEKPNFDTIVVLATLHSLSMVAEFAVPAEISGKVDALMPRGTLPYFPAINQAGERQEEQTNRELAHTGHCPVEYCLDVQL